MSATALREQFERLVRQHADELWRFARGLVGDVQTAEDLVQEAFLQAWRALASLRDPSQARGWLYTILRRRWYRWRRDRAVLPTPGGSDVLATADPPGPPGSPPPGALDVRLLEALACLAPGFREAFLLVVQAGQTCEEAARLLDVPLGTVLSRVHRARVALRERLGGGRDGAGAAREGQR